MHTANQRRNAPGDSSRSLALSLFAVPPHSNDIGCLLLFQDKYSVDVFAGYRGGLKGSSDLIDQSIGL